MKPDKMIFAALLCLSAWSVSAQEPESPRDVTLKITDRKGRPVSGVVVQSVPQGNGAMTDANGMHVFSGMTDRDSILMMLPRYGETILSVAGMDSIVVAVRNTRQFVYSDQWDQEFTDGYTVNKERNRTQSGTTLDVQEMLKTTHATSISELLQGRVAGLTIQRSPSGETSANIRGQRSFLGSNEPLVVVDGLPLGELSQVDQMIDIRQIKTIDIVKEGSMYGSRGANGVIVVTTVK
jgi:hypothetical protein